MWRQPALGHSMWAVPARDWCVAGRAMLGPGQNRVLLDGPLCCDPNGHIYLGHFNSNSSWSRTTQKLQVKATLSRIRADQNKCLETSSRKKLQHNDMLAHSSLSQSNLPLPPLYFSLCKQRNQWRAVGAVTVEIPDAADTSLVEHHWSMTPAQLGG
jgi:hypothetical protein